MKCTYELFVLHVVRLDFILYRVLVPSKTEMFVKSIAGVMYLVEVFCERRAALPTLKIAGTG